MNQRKKRRSISILKDTENSKKTKDICNEYKVAKSAISRAKENKENSEEDAFKTYVNLISQDSFICDLIEFNEEKPKRCVPTQTQIRQQLGSKLSDIFFEYVGNEGRAYLGLEPPLVGPDVVWVNPGARLGKKFSLTTVPDPMVLHLKAFTHQLVLEVGQKHIALLENKHRLETEKALENQAEELEEEFKRRMASASDSNVVEGAGQCKKVVATLMEHFDNCFNELVKTTQLRMRKECQLKIKEERAEVASYMLTELQNEVQHRDMELCSEFHDILQSELNILASRYIRQINTERDIAIQVMRETVRNYEKIISDLRIEMQLSNIVDICQAITRERIDCGERVRQLENEARSNQNDFAKYIKELKTENSTLQKMSTDRLKRLMLWRKKVRELLEEFQRYINFALKSVPGQSEFMLNMEKLMLKKYPEDSFLLPEDYLHFQNCMKGKLSPSEDEEQPKADVWRPSEQEQEDKKSEEKESSNSKETPGFCRGSLDEDEADSMYAFNYDRFKSMLVRQFSSDIKKPLPKKKFRKTVCSLKKKSKEISIDKSNEFYQMLTLAGEDEKEHLAPVDCFLKRRLKAVQKICKDDPEFAKVILGCVDK